MDIEALESPTSSVVAYSPFDPLEVPLELIGLLVHFDGSPVEEARRAIEQRHGVVLDDALVRKLVDFGILVDAEL
jgi:hypothetical protein